MSECVCVCVCVREREREREREGGREVDLIKDQVNSSSIEWLLEVSVSLIVVSSCCRDGGLMVHSTDELPGNRTTLIIAGSNRKRKFSLT